LIVRYARTNNDLTHLRIHHKKSFNWKRSGEIYRNS